MNAADRAYFAHVLRHYGSLSAMLAGLGPKHRIWGVNPFTAPIRTVPLWNPLDEWRGPGVPAWSPV